MVAVNAKLLALARSLRTDAAQRIIVLDATKEGTKILLQTGEPARRPAIPQSPPLPARPLPQAVARAIEAQAGMRPATPAFGEAVRAYDQARADLGPPTDRMADETGRQAMPARADAPGRDGVNFPPARGEPQQTSVIPPPPNQGLVAAGGPTARRTIEHEAATAQHSWSLKWWNPGAPRQPKSPETASLLGKRLAIAAAVIIAGLAIAALL